MNNEGSLFPLEARRMGLQIRSNVLSLLLLCSIPMGAPWGQKLGCLAQTKKQPGKQVEESKASESRSMA